MPCGGPKRSASAGPAHDDLARGAARRRAGAAPVRPKRRRASALEAAVRERGRRAASPAGEVNKRRIALIQPDSYVAEQFRALRGRIDALAAERPIRTIVVTSALPGEGKTTAAINLAIVTALSLGRRVLLIDCDLRKPKVHQALGLRPEAGLAEVLSRRGHPRRRDPQGRGHEPRGARRCAAGRRTPPSCSPARRCGS